MWWIWNSRAPGFGSAFQVQLRWMFLEDGMGLEFVWFSFLCFVNCNMLVPLIFGEMLGNFYEFDIYLIQICNWMDEC